MTFANALPNANLIELVSTNNLSRLSVASGGVTNTATGTIRTGGSALETRVIAGDFTNQVLLDVNESTTLDTTSSTFSHSAGTVDIAAGKTLTVQGGTFAWDGGSSIRRSD